jgi:hypothetical protein
LTRSYLRHYTHVMKFLSVILTFFLTASASARIPTFETYRPTPSYRPSYTPSSSYRSSYTPSTIISPIRPSYIPQMKMPSSRPSYSSGTVLRINNVDNYRVNRVGETTYYNGTYDSFSTRRRGNTTFVSGRNGSYTTTRNGNTIFYSSTSGPRMSGSAVRNGNVTYISGNKAGRTFSGTATQRGNTTFLSGLFGRKQTTPVYSATGRRSGTYTGANGTVFLRQ